MNRRTPRGDYWFVTGIIALSLTLKICALIALYIHTEELRTPSKDKQVIVANHIISNNIVSNNIIGNNRISDSMAS